MTLSVVFIFALGFYITPALLGGGKTIMIAEYIAIQIIDAFCCRTIGKAIRC